MNHEEIKTVEVDNDGEPAVYINSDGNVCGVDEGAAQLFDFESDGIVGLSICSILSKSNLEAGKNLQRMLDGEVEEHQTTLQTDDDRKLDVEMDIEVGVRDDEKVVKATPTNIEVVDSEPSKPDTPVAKDPTDLPLDDVSDDEIQDIVKSIRVDSPEGEMPLNAILLDLAVGHNELEQYKQGALTMHKAVDERMEEEEKRNPNSNEVAVLDEVKKSAFGLYLRIQRGDMELHGHRDGEYSGYFN